MAWILSRLVDWPLPTGTPQEVVRDQAVLDCYLGEETEV